MNKIRPALWKGGFGHHNKSTYTYKGFHILCFLKACSFLTPGFHYTVICSRRNHFAHFKHSWNEKGYRWKQEWMKDNLQNSFFLFLPVVFVYHLEGTQEVIHGGISYILVLPGCCFSTPRSIQSRTQNFSSQSITGLHNLTITKTMIGFFFLGV